jgi:hypothetical protein
MELGQLLAHRNRAAKASYPGYATNMLRPYRQGHESVVGNSNLSRSRKIYSVRAGGTFVPLTPPGPRSTIRPLPPIRQPGFAARSHWRTQRRTESRRFFLPGFPAAWSADFWRRCAGSRKARRSQCPVCKPAHRSPPFSLVRVATPRKGSCPWKIGLQLAALSRVVVPLSALAALFPVRGGARHERTRFVLSHAPRCAVG